MKTRLFKLHGGIKKGLTKISFKINTFHNLHFSFVFHDTGHAIVFPQVVVTSRGQTKFKRTKPEN